MNHVRPGFNTVTPRLFAEDAGGLIEFLGAVFGATGDVETGKPSELRIGDSVLMVAPAVERDVFLACLYIYVPDTDATYATAVEAGAETLEAPLDTPYGDRRAMVRDTHGNVYQIATAVEPS